jgi:hypothetical protein
MERLEEEEDGFEKCPSTFPAQSLLIFIYK